MESFTDYDASAMNRTVGAACLISLVIGLVFLFVRAPHPWGWNGFDHYHEIALNARRRPAVFDAGSALGLRVLPGGVLSSLRRPSVDSAARSGGAQRDDSAAALRRGAPVDGSRDRIARGPARRRLLLQHRLRVHTVVRRRLHGSVPRRHRRLHGGRPEGSTFLVCVHRPADRYRVAIPPQPDSDSAAPRRLRGLAAAHSPVRRSRRRAPGVLPAPC